MRPLPLALLTVLAQEPAQRTSLDELVAKARGTLVDKLDSAIDRYLEALPRALGPFDEGSVRDELFDVEQDAAALAFDEAVREPLLAYFDEQTSAALGD